MVIIIKLYYVFHRPMIPFYLTLGLWMANTTMD